MAMRLAIRYYYYYCSVINCDVDVDAHNFAIYFYLLFHFYVRHERHSSDICRSSWRLTATLAKLSASSKSSIHGWKRPAAISVLFFYFYFIIYFEPAARIASSSSIHARMQEGRSTL